MNSLLVGLDEVATQNQLSSGWTFAILDSLQWKTVDASRHKDAKGKPMVYHGKKFTQADEQAYRTFLKALRRAAENSNPSLLAFSILDTSMLTALIPMLQRVVHASLVSVGARQPAPIRILQRLFPGLAMLQRLTSSLTGSNEIAIQIDQDNVTKAFATSSVQVNGRSVSLPDLAAKLYEAHRKLQFSSSPVLATSGVAVLADSKSVAVQAADVFGNFAMAFARVHLGDTSARLALKACIFHDAFGDLINTSLLESSAKLRGPDVELLRPGALTLKIV